MSSSSSHQHAVVVLPAVSFAKVGDTAHRRWLAKGRLQYAAQSQEVLLQVLAAIGQPLPEGGLAALRLWGQTGDRPASWIAAADPVYLEAMLDRLRLHVLGPDELPLTQLRSLFESLQEVFGDDRTRAFARIETCGYLRGHQAIATASTSPEMAHLGQVLGILPQGEAARSHDALLSELQMYLHTHHINDERLLAGLRPINSLWIWGGGVVRPPVSRRILPLFSDDPLFKGYWHSCSGMTAPWPGNFEACLDAAVDGFVAVPGGQTAANSLSIALEDLRMLLSRGKLRQLTLLFRDGLRVELRRRHVLRFWRRVPELLTGHDAP